MPKAKFSDVPLPAEWYMKYPALCEFLQELFNDIYGIGTDITGRLDEDNLADDVPILTEDETVSGEWTFSTHPLGIDHGNISGLSDDDHTQYQKESEKDVANGYAGLDESGYLDGDELPALSQTKRGGVPPTGSPSNKFLRDDDSWQTVEGGSGLTHPQVMSRVSLRF